MAVGVVPFLAFALVDPKFWMRASKVLYGLNIAMLLLVFNLGTHHGGAERWIDIGPIQFQPSEFAKLLVVLTLGAFFASNADTTDRVATFGQSVLHVLLPAALILAQPHLGAALVILVIWCSMALVARVPFKFVGIAMAAAVLMIGIVGLRGYQMKRVEALAGHGTKDSNYQATRAKIAFGVGGIFGTGFLRAEAGKYVPDQHTDYIFSVVGEEGGLVGSTFVLATFGFFFYRVWLVVLNAQDPFCRFVATGLLGLLAFHAIVNIAMVLQLLPVVGLWLPFMSYGGTAIWLCMAAVGLLLNVRSRERPILF